MMVIRLGDIVGKRRRGAPDPEAAERARVQETENAIRFITVEQRLIKALVNAANAYSVAIENVKLALVQGVATAEYMDELSGVVTTTRELVALAINSLATFAADPHAWLLSHSESNPLALSDSQNEGGA